MFKVDLSGKEHPWNERNQARGRSWGQRRGSEVRNLQSAKPGRVNSDVYWNSNAGENTSSSYAGTFGQLYNYSDWGNDIVSDDNVSESGHSIASESREHPKERGRQKNERQWRGRRSKHHPPLASSEKLAKSSDVPTEQTDWIDVFKFLLTEFSGRIKFGTFMARKGNLLSGLRQEDVAEWFKNNPFFLTFERNESVKYVSVFIRWARACFNYHDLGTKTCMNKKCGFFHICKDFLSGHCDSESQCQLLHSFKDYGNEHKCSKLHLDIFNNEEIRMIVVRSTPVVCENYNNYGCVNDECTDIHVCSKYLLQECTDGADCRQSHNIKDSEHNLWVLRTFGMDTMAEVTLHKLVIVHKEFQMDAFDSDEVFRLLLTKYNGRSKFQSLLTEKADFLRGVSEIHFAKWLYQNEKFRLFEKNGKIKYVSIYLPGARMCFNYRDANADSCKNKKCNYFHICKGFLTGHCVFRDRCRFLHSFHRQNNCKVSSQLGLDSYSDNEICSIVLRSSPMVCEVYNLNTCDDPDCPDIHVCSKHILRLCTAGGMCPLNHSIKDSQHNMWVLSTFHMETKSEEQIMKQIIVKRLPEKKEKEKVENVVRGGPNQFVMKKAQPCWQPDIYALPQMGSTGPPAGQSQYFKQNFDGKHKHLCENFTWLKTCHKDKLCPHFHHPEHCPYAWYICINEWNGFSSKDNYDIEKAYCDLAPQADFQVVLKKIGVLKVTIDFNTMKANTCNLDSTCVRFSKNAFEVPVQRLSMPSYVEADSATPLNHYSQWCWYFRNNEWEPIQPATLQFTLEEKFVAGQKKYYFERDRFRYRIHFGKMIQLNLDTSTQREVLRRPVQHTSHNLKMAPEMSPYLMQFLPKPPEHAVPAHWSKLDCYQDFELVELKNSVNEYKKVAEQFYGTMNITQQKIVHIFRVQNPGLWDRFCSTKRLMSSRSKNSQGVDERQLFHGTPDLSGVRGICANNFDFRRAGENVGAVYGKGAYFSTSAHYSHSYTGKGSNHYMFVAKVLVGKFAVGESSYSRPPQLQGLTMYDSCVNDISSPSIFVIFDLSQSYPEYLIQYGIIETIPKQSRSSVLHQRPTTTMTSSNMVSQGTSYTVIPRPPTPPLKSSSAYSPIAVRKRPSIRVIPPTLVTPPTSITPPKHHTPPTPVTSQTPIIPQFQQSPSSPIIPHPLARKPSIKNTSSSVPSMDISKGMMSSESRVTSSTTASDNRGSITGIDRFNLYGSPSSHFISNSDKSNSSLSQKDVSETAYETLIMKRTKKKSTCNIS